MIEPVEKTLLPRRPESHLEPSHAWIVGLALDEDGVVVAAPDVRSDDGAWPAPREASERGRPNRSGDAPTDRTTGRRRA
ncbi:MAG TPA: hypothetical protein VFW92_07640 [Candidatus Limnocylindrales bacterium]|jgi:hypothetical protein|nr:hypothetical protein [Candidatus Limnocylindrales bacterium]